MAGPGPCADALVPLVTTATTLPSPSTTSSTTPLYGKGGLGQDTNGGHNSLSANQSHHQSLPTNHAMNLHHHNKDVDSNNYNNTVLSVDTMMTSVDDDASPATPKSHHIGQTTLHSSTSIGRFGTPSHIAISQLAAIDFHDKGDEPASSLHRDRNGTPITKPRDRSLSSGGGGGGGGGVKSPSSRRLQSDDNQTAATAAAAAAVAAASVYCAKEEEHTHLGHHGAAATPPPTPKKTPQSNKSDHDHKHHTQQQHSNHAHAGGDRKGEGEKDNLEVGVGSTRASPAGYSPPGDSGKKRTLAKKLLDSLLVKSPFKFSR